MKNEITGANENKSFIEVKVEYQNGLGLHLKAINNIESVLADYNHYRFWRRRNGGEITKMIKTCTYCKRVWAKQNW